MREPDVVIVGGGPAGLAAAIACARGGVSTVLVERRAFPVDKPCGEGLLPTGVAALERLGVPRAAIDRAGVAIAGVRYCTSRGRMAEGAFDDDRGVGLRRVDLSSLLVAEARRLTSLEIISGAVADVRLAGGERPCVAIGRDRLRPRLVIAADGLSSHVRRSLGIGTIVGRPRRWGVRQHFDGEPWTDYVEVHFGDGIDAYVTPLRDGVNVAVLWDEARAGVDRGAPVAATLVARMPRLAARVAARRPVGRARAAGPFHQRPRERARDGLLFAGDAAGYIDPLTGEGVGLALQQAEVFERCVVPHLQTRESGAVPVDVLAACLRAGDAASRAHRQLTRLMLRLARHPSLVERVVALVGNNPALFRHCLDVNMGRRSLWAAPWHAVFALGRTLRVQAEPRQTL